MIPTLGQKVWVENSGGNVPAGVYAAIVLGPNPSIGEGWWRIDLENYPNHPYGQSAHQQQMRPRDDPPPQQEPKREQMGDWDSCEWKPNPVWQPTNPNIVTVNVPAREVA